MEYMRKLPRIPVDKIFDDITYIVPIYQRNYAWESQIEQMLEDILTTPAEVNYYLGSLVINELPDHRAEVIDGQQRLTTLYLLFRALQLDFRKDALQFAARSKYTLTLKDLDNLDPLLGENAYADELIDGYRIIQNYLQEKHVQKTDLQKRLKHIFLIQIPVPKNIDLNHYFEIMNTRGEQLEPHEIAKGKILSVLNSSDQQAAARIWDACADMERYVQMNFPMGVRRQLFGENWSRLCTADFDQTAAYLNTSPPFISCFKRPKLLLPCRQPNRARQRNNGLNRCFLSNIFCFTPMRRCCWPPLTRLSPPRRRSPRSRPKDC